MGSTVWTDEESQYIKAMLNWKEKPEHLDSARSSRVLLGSAPETALRQPVGEFRILVIGAKAVGKTSIITKVTQAHFSCLLALCYVWPALSDEKRSSSAQARYLASRILFTRAAAAILSSSTNKFIRPMCSNFPPSTCPLTRCSSRQLQSRRPLFWSMLSTTRPPFACALVSPNSYATASARQLVGTVSYYWVINATLTMKTAAFGGWKVAKRPQP